MATFYPKVNKFPGLCAFCNVSVDAFQGSYIYVKKEGGGFNRKGRPEGTSHIFCETHYENACRGEINFDRKGQPISKNAPTPENIPENNRWEAKEDTGSLGEALKRALESQGEAKEGADDTEVSDDAATLAKMLQKLAGKASVDESSVRRIAGQMNNETETRIYNELETRLKNIQTTPPIKLEIKQGNEIKLIDTGLQHEILPDVLMPVSQGLHVFLVGPAGSGKTTIGSQIAKALGKDFYFTGAVSSEYKLTGFRDGHGNYAPTAFRKAFEHGGVFLFDEMDASAANALLAFNAALSNGHMDFPDRIVEKHPDFVAIAAANTYGHGADRVYVGRNQLDAATLDRFVTVEMGYDHKLEKSICGNDPLTVRWVEYVQATRKAVANLQMRYVVSPRASLQGSKLLLAGMDKGKVTKSVLYKAMKPEDVVKVQSQTGIFYA